MKRRTSRLLSFFLTLCMMLGLLPGTAWAVETEDFSGGSGSSDDPYLITSYQDMISLTTRVNSGESFSGQYFTMENDISLSSVENWVPIGTSDCPFAGQFNGGGHTISGLKSVGYDYAGLFGYIKGDHDNTGVCYLNVCGEINGTIAVGGIVGNLDYPSGSGYNSYITDCSFFGSVNGGRFTGGIVGSNYGGHVYRCCNYADVYASAESGYVCSVGGVVGRMGWVSLVSVNGIVRNCYNAGDLYGSSNIMYVGGIVGHHDEGPVEYCYNIGKIDGITVSTGGVIGDQSGGQVNACYYLDSSAARGEGSHNSSAPYSQAYPLESSKFAYESSFSGWDFSNIWVIKDGYPSLRDVTEITVPLYSITYILNGETVNVPIKRYFAGQMVTVIAEDPTLDGYTFGGWSDGSTTYQSGESFTMPGQDITLIAIWEKDSQIEPSIPGGIVNLYPANGSTFDHASTSADARFHITFDREIANAGGNRPALDFSGNTLQVHKASDDSVVYEVAESSFTTGTSTNVSLWGSSAPFTAISISGITPELNNGTEYYVTMPAGFVKFADGTASPAINKGDWHFTTLV